MLPKKQLSGAQNRKKNWSRYYSWRFCIKKCPKAVFYKALKRYSFIWGNNHNSYFTVLLASSMYCHFFHELNIWCAWVASSKARSNAEVQCSTGRQQEADDANAEFFCCCTKQSTAIIRLHEAGVFAFCLLSLCSSMMWFWFLSAFLRERFICFFHVVDLGTAWMTSRCSTRRDWRWF